MTVSVQYFCPLFFLHQCLLHIFAECCQFTSVSVICFLFTGVHFILLLYVVCCCVTPAFLLSVFVLQVSVPCFVCHQCLSSVSVIWFLFTGVCPCFCPALLLQCVPRFLPCFLLPMSTQCFRHIVISVEFCVVCFKEKSEIASFCAPPDFFPRPN